MFNNDDLCSLRWDPVHHAVEVIDQTLLLYRSLTDS